MSWQGDGLCMLESVVDEDVTFSRVCSLSCAGSHGPQDSYLRLPPCEEP